MHSIKNTIVAVILLGVSYGVYQVLTTTDPTEGDADMMQMLSVNDNPMDLPDGFKPQLPDQAGQGSSAFGKSLPNQAALEIPDSLLNEMSPLPTATELPKDLSKTTTAISAQTFPPANTGNSFEPSAPVPPSSNRATTAGSYPDGSMAPPLVDVPHRDTGMERDQALIEGLKDEINPSSGFESDSLVASPKGNLTHVEPRPTDTQAAKAMFDPSVAPVSTSTVTLESAWPKIESLVAEGQFQQALGELTQYYRSSTTPDDQRQKLLNWLDLLAAKVIYSSEHHLRKTPYIIQPGDTIADLARQWLVPAQLIYNINRHKIPDPNGLVPGTELKMIQGPFDAEIDTEKGVMTLYLDQMYAGRFRVRSGNSIEAGDFKIVDKSARGNEQKPFWIGLSGGINMFGSDNPTVSDSDIGLSEDEASDVFSILSASSKVRVLR